MQDQASFAFDALDTATTNSGGLLQALGKQFHELELESDAAIAISPLLDRFRSRYLVCLHGGADALMLSCEQDPVDSAQAVQGFAATMGVVRSSLLRLDNLLPIAVGATNATNKGKPTSTVLQELAARVPLAALALGGALWLGASEKLVLARNFYVTCLSEVAP